MCVCRLPFGSGWLGLTRRHDADDHRRQGCRPPRRFRSRRRSVGSLGFGCRFGLGRTGHSGTGRPSDVRCGQPAGSPACGAGTMPAAPIGRMPTSPAGERPGGSETIMARRNGTIDKRPSGRPRHRPAIDGQCEKASVRPKRDGGHMRSRRSGASEARPARAAAWTPRRIPPQLHDAPSGAGRTADGPRVGTSELSSLRRRRGGRPATRGREPAGRRSNARKLRAGRGRAAAGGNPRGRRDAADAVPGAGPIDSGSE